jgi:hypothetical protein
MNRRRATTVAGGLVVVLIVVLAGTRGADAGTDAEGTGSSMLDRARNAAAAHEFKGTVVIEWRDGTGIHKRTVTVAMNGGVLRMDDELVSAGDRRLMRTGGSWQLMWEGAPQGAGPDATEKYRFVVARPATVANRMATEVEVGRSGAKGARELLFFDDATGMLLRRDQLDARGHLEHRFAFVKVSELRPVDASKPDTAPKVDAQSRASAPHSLAGVPDGLQAPKRAGKGFVLTGMYSQPDGSVQLYYSDGLLGLSVFEREGELAWGSLPAGGRVVAMRGVRAKVYSTAAGTAVVWGHDSITYTCVTDAPMDDVTAVMADFTRGKDSGFIDDVGRFVTAPFTWD